MKASKAIKQLELLSIIPGVDKAVMKHVIANLMERIIHGESSSRNYKPRHRQPSRLLKQLCTKLRGA